MEKTAQIIYDENNMLKIKVNIESSCAGCQSKDVCEQGQIKFLEIEKNNLQFEVGDNVKLKLSTSKFY